MKEDEGSLRILLNRYYVGYIRQTTYKVISISYVMVANNST